MGKYVPTKINTEDPKIAAVVKRKLKKSNEAEEKAQKKSKRRKSGNETTVDNIRHDQEENRVRNSSSEYNQEPTGDREVSDSSIGIG